MANTDTVRPEDVTSVGTRISWGAVIAGGVVAMAVYVVLTTLGAAIGFSIGRDTRVETLANGALVWAIATTALALFAGGWTTSQLTAGETKCESMIHGLILWGTVVAAMLWMTASGIRSGFNGMLSVAYAGHVATEGDLDAAARQLGFNQAQIDEAKAKLNRTAEDARDTANDRDTRDQAKDSARRGAAMITWGALFGILLSMGAAIGGAVVGAGPSRQLLWGGKPPLQRVPADRPHANQI
jgi:hypothetical protein